MRMVVIMIKKAELMDESAMHRTLMRISHEIIEGNGGADNICIVGIKRRGVPIAQILAKNIEKIEGVTVPTGELDITFYRDDLQKNEENPKLKEINLPFEVKDKTIVLADDVIYTGRTVRAGIEAIFSCGRPSKIRLAVLIDRGHRELPIRPDYVGKNIPTSHSEYVSVCVESIDGKNCVELFGTEKG